MRCVTTTRSALPAWRRPLRSAARRGARPDPHRRLVDRLSLRHRRRRAVRQQTNFKTPIIESTGSGGGLKLFCAGVGVEHPDITNASRRIKESEVDTCAENGVTEITEVQIGYDGIVIANSQEARR